MFKKMKSLLSLFICILILCAVMPIMSYAAYNDVASVSFEGNTNFYTTIDEAWDVAISFDTTAENKATIKLLDDCRAENTLTNTEDYLVLDTNGKTLTTPNGYYPSSSVLCGIGVDGGSLELTGNGTISGVTGSNFEKATILINGGAVYADGITIYNAGDQGSNTVRIVGGEFYLLDGYLRTAREYALYAVKGSVYLYSGKIEGTGRMAMIARSDAYVQICYSDKPLFLIDNETSNWSVISGAANIRLEDNVMMDIEYSDNPDGSDSTLLKNVTEISTEANSGNYLKIQTFKSNCLFSTSLDSTLLSKISSDGVTEIGADAITAVHFVDLADYNLTDTVCSDYSANGNNSIKAWMDGTELYIGGYGKIIAGKSLAGAFCGGEKINSITGLDILDTSNVTDMSSMFSGCGYNSTDFTLDLGNNFDTSNVTDMKCMFDACGYSSTKFTLNLGDKFSTANVTDMSCMFAGCGHSSTVFTLDLGDQFDTSNVTSMSQMFDECGYSSTEFTLNLGTKFNTSKVTDMEYMFNRCGQDSTKFTLDLGDKFDTSNVTNMAFMFYFCGYSSRDFTLNIGDKFDTSNVTDMGHMFSFTGYVSKVFTLDLGDKFNTSSVTDMRDMFEACGGHSPVFTLNLGNKFDTSNVTNMESMFSFCGEDSTVFTLDLGSWFDTSKVTNMLNMFRLCAYDSEAFTLDLGDKFTASKATDMRYMFYKCGYKSKAFTTLDLSTFTLSTKTQLRGFASNTPVTTFIFGEGWANATLPTAGSEAGAFYAENQISTTVIGATDNLINYDWASDNRTVNISKPQVYTITATAEDGGTVSGGGEVTEGDSVTLTATANDGYTFDSWYDGDTKFCETAEFVVENVMADKRYTAKFTKNQVDPEPEEPLVPYLEWDGSTLTLVKKATASCRVGIVYVGGATFDADNINWDKLVAAGKEYTNLNSSVGYAVYTDFTKRTPGTRGNYVAFVKYTKDDGATAVDYITYNVKNAVSFEIPSLSYNIKTKTLKMNGNVSSTIGAAYVGDTEFNANNLTWNDFIKAGKKYQDINGSGGYEKVLNTLDYTKTFDNNGNYVAFIKYFDENVNKTLAKYYTFTVADYEPQPTDGPFVTAEEGKIVLSASGFDVAKVTIAYIGTDDMYITNWNEFSAAAAKFSDINGKLLKQQYTNPKDGKAWGQNTAGWYAVYIRYMKDGERCNSYYTVELN